MSEGACAVARIDEIIAFNQKVLSDGVKPTGLTVDAKRELCIVTCVDPRLTRFFSGMLGIDRGDAVLIRLPGAALTNGHSDALRAVAAAVYINKAKEFLVMGHTDCGTTRVDASAVSSEMQARGVSPSSMPGGVRAFLGAIGDMRLSLKQSAAAIRSAPYLPKDILVHAAILDIATGQLDVIERGENFQDDAADAEEGSLKYRAGRVDSLGGAMLGDGMRALAAGSGSAIFDGEALLAPTIDAFAGLSSQLPPGWSDGAAALASQALPTPDAAMSALQNVPTLSIAPPITSSVRLQSSVQMSAPTELDQPEMAAPKPMSLDAPAPNSAPPPIRKQQKHHPPGNRPAPQAQPARESPRAQQQQAPAGNPNLAKVRDFYRLEFTLDQRRTIAKQLQQASARGAPSSELVKTVVKPILDLGQKRYKVIDEVIAIKEMASNLPPDYALAFLSQLFD